MASLMPPEALARVALMLRVAILSPVRPLPASELYVETLVATVSVVTVVISSTSPPTTIFPRATNHHPAAP